MQEILWSAGQCVVGLVETKSYWADGPIQWASEQLHTRD